MNRSSRRERTWSRSAAAPPPDGGVLAFIGGPASDWLAKPTPSRSGMSLASVCLGSAFQCDSSNSDARLPRRGDHDTGTTSPHGGHQRPTRSTTSRRAGFSWCSISGHGRPSSRGLLHRSPRLQAGTPAAPGVRERLTRGLAASAQRSRGVRLSSDAGRSAATTGWVEPRGPSRGRSSHAHSGPERGWAPASQ